MQANQTYKAQYPDEVLERYQSGTVMSYQIIFDKVIRSQIQWLPAQIKTTAKQKILSY